MASVPHTARISTVEVIVMGLISVGDSKILLCPRLDRVMLINSPLKTHSSSVSLPSPLLFPKLALRLINLR